MDDLIDEYVSTVLFDDEGAEELEQRLLARGSTRVPELLLAFRMADLLEQVYTQLDGGLSAGTIGLVEQKLGLAE